jgi:hypothetical protein
MCASHGSTVSYFSAPASKLEQNEVGYRNHGLPSWPMDRFGIRDEFARGNAVILARDASLSVNQFYSAIPRSSFG